MRCNVRDSHTTKAGRSKHSCAIIKPGEEWPKHQKEKTYQILFWRRRLGQSKQSKGWLTIDLSDSHDGNEDQDDQMDVDSPKANASSADYNG